MHHFFVDTYHEGATPLRWEQSGDSLIDLFPIPDHARFSPNRQFTQWDVAIVVPPGALGSKVTVRLATLNNCWNGHLNAAMRHEPVTAVVCADGGSWQGLAGRRSETPGFEVEYDLELRTPRIRFAHIVPYPPSRLLALLQRSAATPNARCYPIGATVEGRPLEVLEVGNPAASHHVFLRARAHPWETGGSWLIEGLVEFLLSPGAVARDILADMRFSLMPMANTDGVHRGMTRFTVTGIDLNRGWSRDTPHDPVLAPENACLQSWFDSRRRQGDLPCLAICIHNDDDGKLHMAHPREHGEAYAARMVHLERLLRTQTWFREGHAAASFHNAGTFGEGIVDTYGVDSLVWELNARWAEGLQRQPLHTDWQAMGRAFAGVAHQYARTRDL